MGELVDERDPGPSSQYRVEIHLLQAASPVFDGLAGDDFEAVDHFLGERPPVGLDEADDDIGAPCSPALALAEHRVGLADARGRAQVDAKWPAASTWSVSAGASLTPSSVPSELVTFIWSVISAASLCAPLVGVGRLDAAGCRSAGCRSLAAAIHSGSFFDEIARGGRAAVQLLWAIGPSGPPVDPDDDRIAWPARRRQPYVAVPPRLRIQRRPRPGRAAQEFCALAVAGGSPGTAGMCRLWRIASGLAPSPGGPLEQGHDLAARPWPIWRPCPARDRTGRAPTTRTHVEWI